ncbi:MAG TPA: mechanosensitive ion channel domain-containing protein [Pyrinomonadaceae bacterium]|nr:mechanosensitive ion channel domain-containing protein [Pyrinomonadaceae bacterium]
MMGILSQTPFLNLFLLWQGGENVLQRIWRYINHKFTVGNFEISLASVVIGVFVFIVAVIISRSVRAFMERRMAARANLDPGIQYTVLRLIHYLVITLGVLFALKTAFSLDLTTLAVVFTALSVGIGFGLQFIAGDIASGFILLFERPVRVGDFITITGPDSKLTEGRVQSINLRTTIVMTNDHIAAVVPNSKLVNENLINWSFGERRSRISIPIGVAYDSDVKLVTETLLGAAEGVEHVLEEPKPSVQFLSFGDYSLNFRLLVWTNRPRRHPRIKSDINYRIHQLFKEAKIEIPFPQQDLNLRGGALQLKSADDSGPEEAFEDEEKEEVKVVNRK